MQQFAAAWGSWVLYYEVTIEGLSTLLTIRNVADSWTAIDFAIDPERANPLLSFREMCDYA